MATASTTAMMMINVESEVAVVGSFKMNRVIAVLLPVKLIVLFRVMQPSLTIFRV